MPSTRRDTTSWSPWCRSACVSSEETSSGCCIMSPFIVSCLSQFVEGVYVSAGVPSAGGTSGATVEALARSMSAT